MWGKLRTALGQPIMVIALCAPAWLLLGLCRLAILTTPLRLLHRLYGSDAPLDYKASEIDERHSVRAGHVKTAIVISAKYTPWQSNCYPQALTAHLLLCGYRVPHVIYFGMQKKSSRTGDYAAHAWVMAGEIAVAGGKNGGRYTIVRAFAN